MSSVEGEMHAHGLNLCSRNSPEGAVDGVWLKE
jgi:hypothetical protein